jgi:hypothetical protein
MNAADELIDKYFDRKTEQREMGENKKPAKDLDEKSQKRIRIMQRSKDSLKIYEKIMDNVDLELDREEVERAKSTARAKDGERMYDIQSEYSKAAEKAGAKDKNSMDYFVAKGAVEAYKALWNLSSGKEDSLDEQQMQSVKKGLANLILHEVMKSPQGDSIHESKPKNLYTYNQELDKFCKSEAFEKIAPKTITKRALRNLLADKKNIEKLYEDFNKEVEREAKRDARISLNNEHKEALNNNIDNGVQRPRANDIKTNVQRPRSGAIHQAAPEGQPANEVPKGPVK